MHGTMNLKFISSVSVYPVCETIVSYCRCSRFKKYLCSRKMSCNARKSKTWGKLSFVLKVFWLSKVGCLINIIPKVGQSPKTKSRPPRWTVGMNLTNTSWKESNKAENLKGKTTPKLEESIAKEE